MNQIMCRNKTITTDLEILKIENLMKNVVAVIYSFVIFANFELKKYLTGTNKKIYIKNNVSFQKVKYFSK